MLIALAMLPRMEPLLRRAARRAASRMLIFRKRFAGQRSEAGRRRSSGVRARFRVEFAPRFKCARRWRLVHAARVVRRQELRESCSLGACFERAELRVAIVVSGREDPPAGLSRYFASDSPGRIIGNVALRQRLARRVHRAREAKRISMREVRGRSGGRSASALRRRCHPAASAASRPSRRPPRRPKSRPSRARLKLAARRRGRMRSRGDALTRCSQAAERLSRVAGSMAWLFVRRA